MRRTLIAALALPLLLAACTGTEETPPNLRLVVADVSGTTVRAYNPTTGAQTATRASDAPVVSLIDDGTGTRVLETRTTGVRRIDAALTPGGAFTALTPAPCLVRARASESRDLLAVLSACTGELQRLALYRADGTLVWQATLPPPTPTTAEATRFAVTDGSTVTVARPNLTGGSDVLRITDGTPATLFSTDATINDLAVYRRTLYAATNSDVRPVNVDAAPALGAAVLSGKASRLFTGLNLLAAWNVDSGRLTFWNGTAGTSTPLDRTFTDLRDLTLASDGYAYVLTGTDVTRLDTYSLTGTTGGTPTVIIGGLSDARALSWVIPPDTATTP
ncbi:hypothetical protein [Deinococcus maricopensis]|uniref:Lipoprotein n=1 Tax=Deinococcus maricopensis (strain DSM 21211 / LMG 22137 / NRRL B-23946 / LB-34) TaxID=709986 RepID=E8UC66_DEIML|nr:hypothetical protein [Deinococcus maricopensis]ADV68727.1 conserved hypothetical protein, precursor [Deinococcus maricopensis DSM 21211]